MQAYIFYFFLSLGVFQGFFMAILLLFIKSPTARANRILSLLFIELSISLLCMVAGLAGYIKVEMVRLISTPLLFLLGPCLYFYIVQYHNPTAGFKIQDAAHLIPSALAVAYYPPRYFFGAWASFANYNIITELFWDLFLVHFMAYIFFSILTLRKYIHPSGKPSSGPGIDPVHSWFMFLYRFFQISLVIMAAVTIDDRISTYTRFRGLGLSDNIIAVIGLLIIYGISFRGLIHPAIFFENSRIFSFRKNEAMPAERVKTIMSRLCSLIEKEKPYLDPDLTLPDLAEMTGFPRSDLSKAINTDRHQNFYDFINASRVETAKNLLAENDEVNMLEIAYMSGFKSKSTFNDAFKRNTGLTPTEYKNSLSAGRATGAKKSGKDE